MIIIDSNFNYKTLLTIDACAPEYLRGLIIDDSQQFGFVSNFDLLYTVKQLSVKFFSYRHNRTYVEQIFNMSLKK